MLRRMMAAWLVLAMAAGPNLCCCALPRLLARLAERREAPVEAPPSCCPCGKEPETPQAPSEESPCKHGCPCREGDPAQLDRLVEASQQSLGCQWLASLPAVSDGLLAESRLSAPASAPPRRTRGMLHLCQRLRC